VPSLSTITTIASAIPRPNQAPQQSHDDTFCAFLLRIVQRTTGIIIALVPTGMVTDDGIGT